MAPVTAFDDDTAAGQIVTTVWNSEDTFDVCVVNVREILKLWREAILAEGKPSLSEKEAK